MLWRIGFWIGYIERDMEFIKMESKIRLGSIYWVGVLGRPLHQSFGISALATRGSIFNRRFIIPFYFCELRCGVSKGLRRGFLKIYITYIAPTNSNEMWGLKA
jgi:hypothetical protein